MAVTDTETVIDGQYCPECDAPARPDGTEVVCAECGLVVSEDRIDHGPDWRAFDAAERRQRKHAKATDRDLYDNGLGSEIGHARERNTKQSRLDRWHRQAKSGDKKERGKTYVLSEIRRIGVGVELPEPDRRQAKAIHRQYDSERLYGKNLDVLAAACVWLASRVNRRGISPDAIAEVARDVDRWKVARWSRRVAREVGLEVPPPDPEQRVRVVASELDADLDRQTVQDAIGRLENAPVGSGASPSTLAAAALYAAAGGRYGDVTQADVAAAADVTPTSVRNHVDTVEGSA